MELERSYCETLRSNLAQAAGAGATQILNEDIRDFDPRPFLNRGIQCVIGGPPCQTFSAAGRRAGGVIGTEDSRGQLFTAYCRVLRELKPQVFVFENVYGLSGANGGGPWREISGAFAKLGYTLKAEVLDAADYGVPQHRERLILVGYKAGDFTFPLPTHGPDSADMRPLVSVQDAIRDLQDPREPYHDDLGGMYGHLLPLVPEGLNYSYFTAEMNHPEPVFAWRSKFHDLLYKVSRTEPCRTIKAQPGKFTGPFHWKNRHFSVAELKRLQTFPDEYELVGSYSKVVHQIGNSVPPRLAFVVASSVRDQLLKGARTPVFAVRPSGFSSTFRQRQRERTKKFDSIAGDAIKKHYGNRLRVASGAARGKRRSETYLISASGLFGESAVVTRAKATHAVTVSERRRHIQIGFESTAADAANRFVVEMKGLCKYLPDFDSLTIEGTAGPLIDAFRAWRVIERALTKRSRFFSLIDIYGHYANRGDTVKVSGQWALSEDSEILRTLNWVTASENCGEFHDLAAFSESVQISKGSIPGVIETMRSVRFDCRSSLTHPIIGVRGMICTYPFPLLSPRALVESRAVFTEAASRSGELRRAR